MKFFAVFFILFLSFSAVEDLFGRNTENDNASIFSNPTKLSQTVKCSSENLDAARFSNQFGTKSKIKVCEGMDLFIKHTRLAANNSPPKLNEQMKSVWRTFIETKTRFMLMPKDKENSFFAAASAFPNANIYRAAVYVSPEKTDSELFFYIFWHELKHIHDIKEVWEKRSRISNYKLEFNGFYFASELAEFYRPKNWDPRYSGFWRDEWKNLSAEQKYTLRKQAIDDFMDKNPVYADTRDRNETQYDFTKN